MIFGASLYCQKPLGRVLSVLSGWLRCVTRTAVARGGALCRVSRTFIGNPPGGCGRDRLKPSRLGWLGLCGSLVGFSGTIFVFVRVQVLQSYPFFNGVFGNEQLFPGVTYTVGLEIFALLALIGVFAWFYSRTEGGRRQRIGEGAGSTLLVFGILVAGIVYVETCLLWGNVVPGVHVWPGLPGGGGYPWGSEQVAYNTCFIASAVSGDCTFFNYDELFWLAVAFTIAGFVMRYSSWSSE